MAQTPTDQELCAAIEAKSAALAAYALARMYENPFWDERFGARGRQFATEDGHHHVKYLLVSLQMNSPDTLTHYAGWLRSVLTTRGMCSRHIMENFARLAEAIRALSIPQPERATDYLEQASAALLYADGPARQVQLAGDELVERAMECFAADPGGAVPDATRRFLQGELSYDISYLADALALQRPAVLVDHVVWQHGFVERHGVPGTVLARCLGRLEEALLALPAPAQFQARQHLARAVAALRSQDRPSVTGPLR